jgi:copper resistance protein B
VTNFVGQGGVLRWILSLSAGAVLCVPGAASAQLMDNAIYTFVRLGEAEYVSHSTADPFAYNADGWIGGDYTRVWFRAQGEHGRESEGAVEAQVLYSRLVRPFWDLQIGARLDVLYGDESATRSLLAVGFQGLAPYWFEVESFVFVSDGGDVSARFEAMYDLPITQRLILEPEVSVDVAVQEVPEFAVGSGLSSLEIGARLRYEIVREFAPYVGWIYEGRFGGSADFSREAGEPARYGSFIAGIRMWR